jgi:hypothetical protein
MTFEEAQQEYDRLVGAYSGKSVDELFALTNGNEIGFLIAIEIAIHQKEEREEQELSEEETLVLAVEALEREVNNGGFSQFFVNSSRVYTPIIADALQRIGCPETARIAERAVKAAGFQGLPPFRLCQALEAYCAEYLRRNKHRFVAPGSASGIEEIASVSLPAESEFQYGATWELRDEELDECDRLYYGAGENIGGQLIGFINANKNAIQP